MKRAGRKRRAAGWTLLALGLLVAGLWVWSGSRNAFFAVGQGWTVFLGQGEAVLFESKEAVDLTSITQFESTNWRFRVGSTAMFTVADSQVQGEMYDYYLFALMPYNDPCYGLRYQNGVIVVLWPLTLLLWTPAALLLRSGIVARRRAMKGICKKCGYSLAGLPAGSPCPECGKANTGHG